MNKYGGLNLDRGNRLNTIKNMFPINPPTAQIRKGYEVVKDYIPEFLTITTSLVALVVIAFVIYRKSTKDGKKA
jgi:hypothetical protein